MRFSVSAIEKVTCAKTLDFEGVWGPPLSESREDFCKMRLSGNLAEYTDTQKQVLL
jgi:hypothetical protein